MIVNYVGNEEASGQVVDDIHSSGGKALAVRADVSNPQEATRLFREAERAVGGIDVLVNNAGVMPGSLPRLRDTDDATFEQVIAVNLRGTFNMLREAAQHLRPGGRIINISSSVVSLKPEGYSVYAASKAAVETMSAILARELRGQRISVNTIAPGPTGTELFLEGKSPEMVARAAGLSPLERLGEPQDIANVVSFLASEKGEWINGQVLRANGGAV